MQPSRKWQDCIYEIAHDTQAISTKSPGMKISSPIQSGPESGIASVSLRSLVSYRHKKSILAKNSSVSPVSLYR